MTMTPTGYAAIGITVVTVIGFLFKWWITKTLDSKFSKREREEADFRKEQIEDAIRQSQGQQVMTNSLLVILRHMIYGNHVEDLERSAKDLQAFHDANESAMMRKAAKYNLR